MDLTGLKADANKLSLSELRQLGRDEIAELVTAGLLEADRAAEIQSEDAQHKQEELQSTDRQRFQAHQKIEEQKKENDWLHSMSQSYQQAYSQLMETYDNVETEYGTIKSRAEKLKDSLRDKIETARQFGISLPDGTQAFYDRKNSDFVDGATLQKLDGDDAKAAAAGFKLLSPHQQDANAHYIDVCHAYNDADAISQSADAGRLEIQNKRTAVANSQGTLSEDDLAKRMKNVNAKAADVAAKLDKAENADADFNAVYSASADETDTPKNPAASPSISFAAPVIGNGNGQTTATFNAAVNAVPADDAAPANNPNSPVYRPSSAPVV